MSNINIIRDSFVTIDCVEGKRCIPFSELSVRELQNLHEYSMLSVDDAARASANCDHPATAVFVKLNITPSGVYDVIVDCRVLVAAFVCVANQNVLVCGPEQDRESLVSALSDMCANSAAPKPVAVEPVAVEPVAVEPVAVERSKRMRCFACDCSKHNMSTVVGTRENARMAWDTYAFATAKERDEFVSENHVLRAVIPAKFVCMEICDGKTVYYMPAEHYPAFFSTLK